MNRFQVGLSVLLIAVAGTAQAAEHIWIEGEAFSQPPKPLKRAAGVEEVQDGVGYSVTGWGNTDMISQGQLLQVGNWLTVCTRFVLNCRE